MDVDSMTTNERAKLIRKGAWFKCKKTGHCKDQCPDNEPQKKTGKDVYGRIWAMITKLPKEEQKAMMIWILPKENHFDVSVSFS